MPSYAIKGSSSRRNALATHTSDLSRRLGFTGCFEVAGKACVGVHPEAVASGVTADDAACISCHEHAASASPAVEARQCHHCHAETRATILTTGAPFIHSKHVTDQGVGCDWCHGVVKHGNLELRASAE